MIHYRTCPVCDSEKIQRILTAIDYTVSHQEFEIWQCAHCSLRFTQDIPSAEQIGKYYQSEEYISHSETSKGLVNWLYLKVRKFTLTGKRKIIESETGIKNGTILDVGAGTGAFLHHMKSSGWAVQGVEPDAKAIQRAASQYHLQLQPAESLFQLPQSAFDAITLWHVLEHVHELHNYVSELKNLLKPGGKLFIAVPNYTSLDAHHYQEHWAAYDVPRHLYHFSPAAMQQLMSMHGMAIQKIIPMWFDSFYVSLLSEKYQKSSLALVRGFISGTRSNSKAFSNRRKASSVIYVVAPAHRSPES